ncbi:metallophosphoesterase [Companilactobacillus sp. DQM5]|uniref:metallophosphoesterase n=1 Tax=Companilactobacillus sp. DQM5 TaxID=3463359 RepID=UPI0040593CEA
MFKKILFFIVLIIIFIPIYAFKIEPFLVHTNHIQLGDPHKQEQLKVVQISDIQVSEAYASNRLDRVISKVNKENPDIIVFTGDLFDNYSKYSHSDEIIQKLSSMNATLGKYAVWGNHDYGGGASRIYDNVMTQSGFKVLKNEGRTITLQNGKTLFIGGLDDSLLGNPSVSDTLAYRKQYDYSILLTHEPDVADNFVNTNTQLVLAGHSHGGQIWIPFHPITNNLARKYTRGLYTLSDGTKLYVNTGLGTTSIHARFNVIPEVSSFSIHF